MAVLTQPEVEYYIDLVYATAAQFSEFSDLAVPQSEAELKAMPVGEFLTLLNDAETLIKSTDPYTFQLAYVFYGPSLPRDVRGFLLDWSNGDFAELDQILADIRESFAGIPAETTVSAAIATLPAGNDTGGGDDTGTGGDGDDTGTGGGDDTTDGGDDTGTGGGGDDTGTGGGDDTTGGGDDTGTGGGGDDTGTGGGDDTTDGGDVGDDSPLPDHVVEFGQVRSSAEATLASLLWNETNGVFASPEIMFNPATGQWSVPSNGDLPGYGGTSADALYDKLGEAVMSAILAYAASGETDPWEEGPLGKLGYDSGDLSALGISARNAAEAAVQALQELGMMLTGATAGNVTPEQAEAAAKALVQAIETAMPGSSAVLGDLILGSQNSDPSFFVTFDVPIGTSHGDWLYLTENADSFDGLDGEDIVFGLGGNDTIKGGEQDDFIFGGEDDDMIDGGGGIDTAGFSGAASNYAVQLHSDGSLTVTDHRANGTGTDALSGIESLSFDDTAIDLTVLSGILGLSEEDITTFVEMYIAYFNRAPAATGLMYWGTRLAEGMPLEQIAKSFFVQPESRALYPEDLDNGQLVSAVFNNLLGRDPAGPYWENALNAGDVDRPAFMLAVIKGAKANPDAVADVRTVTDKADLGIYSAVIKGIDDYDQTKAGIAGYDPDDHAASKLASKGTIDGFSDAAMTEGTSEFTISLVGVVDDPFTV